MITREQIEQLGQLVQNVNPDKHYWFFRTMGGYLYDEFVSTCTVEKLLSTCHPIVNSMLCYPSVQFSVDYSNGNNSKRPTPIF